MSEWIEVRASATNVLAFDGRVLEVFGFNDTHRFHVSSGLRIEFEDGRRPRLRITRDGSYLRFDYDPSCRVKLEEFARRVNSTHSSL